MKHAEVDNPQTPEKIHRDQVAWQILFPTLLVIVICLAGAVVLLKTSAATAGSTEQWAEISLVLLILPFLFFFLVTAVALVFITKQVNQWNQSLPFSLRNIRLTLIRWNQSVQHISMQPTRPIIFLGSLFSGIKTCFQQSINETKSFRRKK